MMKLFKNPIFVFWIVVVDIMFLPYFNIVVMPYSSIIILWWNFKESKGLFKATNIIPELICIFLMFISTIIGSFTNLQYGVLFDNIKRFIQYTLAFGYYCFFDDFFSKYKIDLKKVLWCLVIFVVLFALLFQINSNTFINVASIWNKGNRYGLMVEEADAIMRYNFIWTDPNNIAYVMSGLVSFMLLFTKTALGEKILLLACNIYVLFCCMSSGGWICFVATLLLCVLFPRTKYSFEFNLKNIIITILVIVAVIILIEIGIIEDFLETDVVKNALKRLNENEGGRTQIWKRVLNDDNIFKYILIGKGDQMFYSNGVSKATHSGPLYWIYAYGMLSFAIFMKKFFWIGFKNVKRYIPLVSFLLCFAVNTMVGEQKILVLLVLFVCYLRNNQNIGKGEKDETVNKLDNSCI